jgi:hypothetical protein
MLPSSPAWSHLIPLFDFQQLQTFLEKIDNQFEDSPDSQQVVFYAHSIPSFSCNTNTR